jgi:PKD repeat protein
VFRAPGRYTVRLTVADDGPDGGATASDTLTVTVAPNPLWAAVPLTATPAALELRPDASQRAPLPDGEGTGPAEPETAPPAAGEEAAGEEASLEEAGDAEAGPAEAGDPEAGEERAEADRVRPE